MSHALVIGAGPAGLMAADIISAAGHQVTIADQMPSVGRKFLMAGKSGLNLTKVEPPHQFATAYGTATPVAAAVRDFGPEAVQAWARDLGQTIFTGSTGRVFPTVMKASPLLRAWLVRLDAAGCRLQTRWRWLGWDGTACLFDTPEGQQRITADVTVLALGGASWARLGSDAAWAAQFGQIATFKPANCGFAVPWSPYMATFFGTAVKATQLHAGNVSSRGEWVITARGLEGGGVYEVSAALREGASLSIDLMPDVGLATVQTRIAKRSKKASRQGVLKQALRLPPVKQALFNEFTKGADLSSVDAFAQAVKALPVGSLQPLPIDDAISTAGGVRLDALTPDFMIKAQPGVFAAGEMLDWEAPTGGYLITGCLATGQAAGKGAVWWLSQAKHA